MNSPNSTIAFFSHYCCSITFLLRYKGTESSPMTYFLQDQVVATYMLSAQMFYFAKSFVLLGQWFLANKDRNIFLEGHSLNFLSFSSLMHLLFITFFFKSPQRIHQTKANIFGIISKHVSQRATSLQEKNIYNSRSCLVHFIASQFFKDLPMVSSSCLY